MGALHGHLTLVRAARRVPGAVVVVSIFVNPLQFGAGEDLEAYPRTLDDDLELLRGEGVEIVFAPTAADMYPGGSANHRSSRSAGRRARRCRPPNAFRGHADCRAVVPDVAPDRAYFGEKDYQQLVLIRQMVEDLNLDVRIEPVPIVREPDGTAHVVAEPLSGCRTAERGHGVVVRDVGRPVCGGGWVAAALTPRAPFSTRCRP